MFWFVFMEEKALLKRSMGCMAEDAAARGQLRCRQPFLPAASLPFPQTCSPARDMSISALHVVQRMVGVEP
jgi:hypothetical protein